MNVGKCMCGAVSVTANLGTELHACHCSMCRAMTGGAFMAISAGTDVTFSGPVQRYKSSDWAERGFCGTCGSVLFYHLTIPGQESYELSAGLFEDAGGKQLSKEIFVDYKPDGYAFAGAHKRMTKAEVLASLGQSEGESQ